MKLAIALLAASLALGGSAALAGAKPNESPPVCETLAKLKDGIKGGRFTPLNIGQFNYVLGAYDASTPPHAPLPAADNAFVLRVKGRANDELIVWMKGECASLTPPMPVTEEFAAHLRAIHPTAGETSDAPDDGQDEHL